MTFPLLNTEPWVDQALCAQVDAEMFFPEPCGGVKAVRQAKRVCGSCPVREQCLEYALAHGERFGVWGGASERERRQMKRERPRRTHCDKGHALEYTGRRPDGRCAQCSREWNRARRRDGVA
jgi:WhiB family redox-sensing transcriptional regulator